MLLKDNLLDSQHLAFFVTDVDRSVKFYEQFGFEVILHEDVPMDAGPVRLRFLKFNHLTLELVELPGDAKKEIAARSDGHIDHIAMDVKDVDKAYAELTAAGFKALEPEAPVFLSIWEKGTKYFTVRGPDGEKVEFSQIM
jgi:lactoylglutathione lyase